MSLFGAAKRVDRASRRARGTRGARARHSRGAARPLERARRRRAPSQVRIESQAAYLYLVSGLLGGLVLALAAMLAQNASAARAARAGPSRPPTRRSAPRAKSAAAAVGSKVVGDAEGSAPGMSAWEALLGRRTVNEFAEVLPQGWEDKLTRALECALYAPNHKRTEPWRFHLLGPEAARRVCELNADIVSAKKGPAAGEKKLKRWLAMPGWLVVTCKGSGEGLDAPMSPEREDYAAVCCAVQNLCVALHADGIGTKWTTGGVNFDPRFRQAAGVPEDEYVVGTIWFGQPAGRPAPKPTKKLGLDDVLTRHD